MTNPVLNPKIYARTTGLALAAVALLGIVLELVAEGKFVSGFLEFDWTHDILHVVLAAIALAVGFAASGNYASIYAKFFGIVYLVLAALGFINGDALGFLGVHLELGENLVHVLIGLWGVVAGFFGSPDLSTSTAPTQTPRRV